MNGVGGSIPSLNEGDQSKPAGLGIEYNHDLDVSDAFLSVYPSLREALKDARLLKAFKYFDENARSCKWSFQLFGLSSLVFGLVPLSVTAIRMMIGEPAFGRIAGINIPAELCGLFSLCLILWARKKRYRILWCQAVFCRERLRQWHFQKFLDGELINTLVSNREQYESEIQRRWGALQQNLRDGHGMMIEFIHHASYANDFFHKTTKYADSGIAKQVFAAVWTLRFEHQIRYSGRKIDLEGEQTGFSLEERTALSETVASVSLAGAILMSVLAFIVSGAHVFALNSWLHWEPLGITRWLGGMALLLAVISAASRAFRAGYTLPDESESYEEYSDRVRELKAVFESLSNDDEKLQALEHLEEESAAELRRFLRMKTRATFVS